MISGQVNASREAVIQVQVRGGGGQTEVVAGAIDTGFTGFLTLAPGVVAALQLPFWETSEFTLADGTDAAFSIYMATVRWDGQDRAVFVLATEGGPLVGMSLLYGCRLTMDVVDGGAVTIEAL